MTMTLKDDLAAATPGPWVDGQTGNFRVYGPDGAGRHSGLIASCLKCRADARLIARAPDMAAALIAAEEALGWAQHHLSEHGISSATVDATLDRIREVLS